MEKIDTANRPPLLDMIRIAAGYSFISDLRFFYQWDYMKIMTIIEQTDTSAYSTEEWATAVCYITGVNQQFATAAKAIGFLKSFTQEIGK